MCYRIAHAPEQGFAGIRTCGARHRYPTALFAFSGKSTLNVGMCW